MTITKALWQEREEAKTIIMPPDCCCQWVFHTNWYFHVMVMIETGFMTDAHLSQLLKRHVRIQFRNKKWWNTRLRHVHIIILGHYTREGKGILNIFPCTKNCCTNITVYGRYAKTTNLQTAENETNMGSRQCWPSEQKLTMLPTRPHLYFHWVSSANSLLSHLCKSTKINMKCKYIYSMCITYEPYVKWCIFFDQLCYKKSFHGNKLHK